jgi:hypothetical protein
MSDVMGRVCLGSLARLTSLMAFAVKGAPSPRPWQGVPLLTELPVALADARLGTLSARGRSLLASHDEGGAPPSGIGSQTSLGGRHPRRARRRGTGGDPARGVSPGPAHTPDAPPRPALPASQHPWLMFAHVPLGSGSAAGPMVSGRSAAGRSAGRFRERARTPRPIGAVRSGLLTPPVEFAGSSPGEVPGFLPGRCAPPLQAGLR